MSLNLKVLVRVIEDAVEMIEVFGVVIAIILVDLVGPPALELQN